MNYSYSPAETYNILRKFNNCIHCSEKINIYVPEKDISLRRLSMISVITNLWSNGSLINNLQTVHELKKTDRDELVDKAKEIVKQYDLPRMVIKEMLVLLEWISYDFILYLDRLMNNEFFLYQGNVGDIIKNIKWDIHGGINEVQTFKNMKYTNDHYNYIVSTLYCLEDDIPTMWSRLSPKYRQNFSLRKMLSGGFDSYATFIIYYWTSRVKNRDLKIHRLEDPIGLFNNIEDSSTNLKMLIVSLHNYYIHAFKYFWNKLDNNERNIAINTLCDIYIFDDLHTLSNFYDTLKNSVIIMLFVLSRVNDEQRLMIIRRCLPQMIINFWQCWQVHHVILPLFENYSMFLDEFSYKQLFSRLREQNGDFAPKDNLLYEMWLSSPPHLQYLISVDEIKNMLLESIKKQVPAVQL